MTSSSSHLSRRSSIEQSEAGSSLLPLPTKTDLITTQVHLPSTTEGSSITHSYSPNWLQAGPVLGLAALLITMGCAFFSLAVLVASNNRTVDSWTVQPTVYLAIAAAIANSAIAFAHARAVPIAWWHAALEGTTIRSLHRQWKTSGSIAHAIANGRHLSLALMTTILVSIMIVDGPLLQRAASVVVATQSKMVQLSLSLSP